MKGKKIFKMVIHGNPGIGKTVLMGSVLDVPEMLPALFIDCEGNTDSIESKCNYIEEYGEASTKELNCIRVTEWGEFWKLYNKILSEGGEPYKTIIIDSLTRVDELSLQNIIKTFGIKRFDPLLPELKDYQKQLSVMLNVFYNLANIDAHIIASCHSYTEVDNAGVVLGIKPLLSGQLRDKIPGIFKQTGVMIMRNADRILKFQPYGKYMAKDLTEGGKMGTDIVNPTMLELYTRRMS